MSEKFLIPQVVNQNAETIFNINTVETLNLQSGNTALNIDKVYFNAVPKPDFEIAKAQLQNTYHCFGGLKKHFGTFSNTHIQRAETWQVINKIVENKDSKPTLVVGNAGMGKSVVIYDVLEELKQVFFCLSIKCTQLTGITNETDFQKSLNIQGDSLELIGIVAKQSKVVVLLDQLDALSSAIRTDRKATTFITEWINKLCGIENVAVVVCCRRYDLDNDDLFKHLNQNNRNVINIPPLSPAEIQKVLAEKIKYIELNTALQELLTTPLHLDIFCGIANEGVQWQTITTLNGLYDALWEDKVIKTQADCTVNQRKQALFDFASDCFEQQQLSTSYKKQEVEHRIAIETLQTCGLITVSDKHISFFHQSFFDYTYARGFAESGKDILSVLDTKSKQTLFVRSQVRYILTYLQDFDKPQCINTLKKILTESDKFRFHIQELAILHLARVNTPNSKEVKLVKNIIIPNAEFTYVFADFSNQKEWFELLEPHFIDATKSNNLSQIRNSLYHLASQDQSRAVAFLEKCLRDKIMTNEDFVWLVWVVKSLHFTEVLNLLELYKSDYFENANSTFWYLLQDTAITFPTWTMQMLLEEFEVFCKKENGDYNSRNYINHHKKEVWKKRVEANPNEAYYAIKKVIFRLIKHFKHPPYKEQKDAFYDDYAFSFSYSDEEEKSNDNQILLYWLKKHIVKSYKEGNKDFAKTEIQSLIRKNFLTCIFTAFQILDEIGEEYADLFYQKIIRDIVIIHKTPSAYTLPSPNIGDNLLSRFFSFFSKEQKDAVIAKVRVTPLREVTQKDYTHLKKEYGKTYTDYDRYKLLNLIPEYERNQYQWAKSEHQEMLRKYGEIEKKENRRSSSRRTYNAYEDKVYEKMSFDNWLKLMKNSIGDDELRQKYGWEHTKPTREGHEQAFKNQIEKNPAKFLPFIKKMVKKQDAPSIFTHDAIRYLTELYKKNQIESNVILEICYYYISSNATLGDYEKMQVCWTLRMIGKLEQSSGREMNASIVNFLIECTLDTDSPVSSMNNDLLMAGANCLRGSAISALYNFIDEEATKIYDVFSNIVLEQNPVLDVVILANFQLLIKRQDDEKVFKLFEILTDTDNQEVLSLALLPLIHLIGLNYAKALPTLKKIMNINFEKSEVRGLDVYRTLAVVIAQARFGNDTGDADELLDMVFDGKNKQLRTDLLHEAILIVAKWETEWEQAYSFIERFYIPSHCQELSSDQIDDFFYQGKENFDRWFPIVEKVVEINGINVLSYQIIAQMTTYCGLSPTYSSKIINLLKNLDFNAFKLEIQTGVPPYFSLLSQLYTESESNKDEDTMNTLLDMYDYCLSVPSLRNNSDLQNNMRRYE